MRRNERKRFITKLYRYWWGSLFDINTNEKIKFPHISTISGECFCWITTLDGKVIRQSFVDENNKQYRYC